MDAGQDTMADFEPGRFRALPRQRLGRIEDAASHDADPAVGDFSATLLAMAGHDLRQPLQIITSAHDVLALTLDSEEQREELTRAAEATAELASMLGQLVEALQLRDDHLLSESTGRGCTGIRVVFTTPNGVPFGTYNNGPFVTLEAPSP